MRFRVILLLVLFAFQTIPLAAQTKTKEWYQEKADEARKFGKVGKKVFLAGTMVTAGCGIILMNARNSGDYTVKQVYGTFALAKLSMLIAGIGFVEWTTESIRNRHYLRKIKSLSLSFSPQPEALVTLRWKLP